jgi:hypothetical protein
VDTGSEVSIISSNLVRKAGLVHKTMPSMTGLVSLGNQVTIASKKLETLISFRNSEDLLPIPISCEIVDITNKDLFIIGLNLKKKTF